MPLPLLPLPTTTVDIAGTPITIRSLSRGERLALVDLELDSRGLEAHLVGLATDTPAEEAKAWLAGVQSEAADALIVAVMEWSGMIAPREEGADVPEDPSSGSTEEQGSGEPSSEP